MQKKLEEAEWKMTLEELERGGVNEIANEIASKVRLQGLHSRVLQEKREKEREEN